MRTIITGSRSIRDYFVVERAITKALGEGLVITEVISGDSPGVERLGERWAREHHIPIKHMPSNWRSRHGLLIGSRRKSELIRNREMVRDVGSRGGVIAVWDGISQETLSLVDDAQHQHLKVFVYNLMLEEEEK